MRERGDSPEARELVAEERGGGKRLVPAVHTQKKI